MEATNKVIAFKTFGKTLHNTLKNDGLEEVSNLQEEKTLVEKARNVLDNIEELWEIDHGSVELRDNIHLLRYYLKRIHK